MSKITWDTPAMRVHVRRATPSGMRRGFDLLCLVAILGSLVAYWIVGEDPTLALEQMIAAVGVFLASLFWLASVTL